MALVVTHNSTADGDPLIDGDDWNANHTLTGGGTFRIPKHIETKTLSSATSTTFSDLNGDTDKIYLVDFRLTISLGDGGAGLIWKPNDSADNQYSVQHRYHNTWDGYSGGTVSRLVYQGSNGDTIYCSGGFTFYAETGTPRTWRGQSTSYISAPTLGHNNSGAWTDTSTNLTSIVLKPDVGTFTGWVKLYKMVDLTI